MIRQEIIDGRAATLSYLSNAFEPANEETAQLIKIVFDDGESVFLKHPNAAKRGTAAKRKLAAVWRQAVAILDASEVEMRDTIERGLADYAGLDHLKVADGLAAADRVSKQCAAIRVKAIKRAFRLLRDKGLP